MMVRSRAGKGLSFGFFLLVCAILAGTGIFILVQHQYSVTNELKSGKIDRQIAGEKAKQKGLRLKLAKLKSPSRISRIAQDELGFQEPGAVIYMKYGRDAQGNMVCQSSYEERTRTPVLPETDDISPSAEVEEPSGALTKR